jgi:hypothetical protein
MTRLLLPMLFLAILAAPAAADETVVYTAQSPVGTARLVARPQAPSLLFRIDRTTPGEIGLDEQAQLLQPLLGRYLAGYHYPQRLFVVFRDTTDLFARIAQSARRSPGWNAKAGRPRRATVSAFIVQEINTRHLAGEFERCFAAFGYALKAGSAEQVLLGASGGDTVPVSASLDFVAEKEPRK